MRRLLVCIAGCAASMSVGAITLDATKINTAGVWAAGNSVPVALRTANAIGRLAGKWPVVIGMSVIDAVIRDLSTDVHWLPGNLEGDPIHWPVPAGWNGASSPPSTISTSIRYRISGYSELYDSLEQACSVGVPLHWSGSYPCFNGTTCIRYSHPSCGGTYLSSVTILNMSACPSGYLLSGGVCVLSEGSTNGYAKWPSDGVGTIVNGGSNAGGGASGQWTDHVREPDADKVNPPAGTLKREGQDEYGNPTKEELEPTPDGGVKYRRWTQGEDSVGAPVTVKHETVTNENGQVTNNTYQYFANQTIENVYNQGGTPTAAQPVDLKLPDDYSRENTLQQTKDKVGEVKDKVVELKDSVESLKEVEQPPEPPDVNGINPEAVEIPEISETGDFAYSGGCPGDISMTVLGHAYAVSLQPMCTGAQVLGPLLVAGSAIVAGFIVFGGRSS